MSILIIFICAVIGLRLDGPVGLVIGAAVGYVLSNILTARVAGGLQQVRSQFLETSFAVMGALCKADGVVTRDEILVTEQLFVRLGLSPEQMAAAKAAFNRGKAPEFDLDGHVDDFARATRGSGVLLQLFLQMQLLAVAADGQVHPAERAMLVRVARRLGLSEADVAQLEALLRASAEGGAPTGAAPAQQRLDDAYVALGVKPDATESEIKRAYRKLISDNHPDRLAAKGMPESMRAIAEERAREINVAYDLIKRARGFS
jgi:DnaJ like chaperone protein